MKPGFLDTLPVEVQHALVTLSVALLGWAGTAMPGMHLPVALSMLLGAVITVLLGWLTPLTRQYGYGSSTTGV